MLNPGVNVVTFTYPGVVQDRLHRVTPIASSSFTQGGCNVQPISVQDKISDTSYSEATEKCLTPFNDDTSSIRAEWFAQYNNANYRILGVKHHLDRMGRGVHITVILKREDG